MLTGTVFLPSLSIEDFHLGAALYKLSSLLLAIKCHWGFWELSAPVGHLASSQQKHLGVRVQTFNKISLLYLT